MKSLRRSRGMVLQLGESARPGGDVGRQMLGNRRYCDESAHTSAEA